MGATPAFDSDTVSAGTGPLVIVSERLGVLGKEEVRIENEGASARSAPLWSLDDIGNHARDAMILLVGSVEPIDRAALELLSRCVAVVRRGVGHDNVDVDAASEMGIVVANVPDASVEEVSDHALALLLALERHVVRLDHAVRDGVWQRDPQGIAKTRGGIRRLSELTLGIVGFGRIGQALARKAINIYGSIVVADPLVNEQAVANAGGTLMPTDELLASADHVSLHAPLNADTRHLIGTDALSVVRPNAIVVNTSRGALVDESALLRAIAEGRIGAAGLDVTEHEPLQADDPLLACEKVVLTAHSAASSTTAAGELHRRSIDAVVDILAGRRPSSTVNPAVFASEKLRARRLRLSK